MNTLFIVGDPSQLLYKFAGARPEVLTTELDHLLPGLKTVKLRVNYRSTQAIIATFDKLNRYNYSDMGGPFPQTLSPDIEAGPSAEAGDPVRWNWYADDVAEADGVAASVNEQLAFGYEPRDFFVLSRTRAQLAEIERALSEAKIPFLNLTGGSFWAQKHIKQTIAYLALAWAEWNLRQTDDNATEPFFQQSSEAFEIIFNVASRYMTVPWGKNKGDYCPHRFLGAAFMDACRVDGTPSYSKAQEAYWERSSWRPGIDDMRDFVNRLIEEVSRFEELKGMEQAMTVGDLLAIIIQECMQPWLRAEEGITEAEDGDKLDDFASVLSTAARFASIPEFLGQVAEWVEAAQNAAKNGDWTKYVVISTIHRVKGLERAIVFGIGWCEGQDENEQPVGLLPHTFSMRSPVKMGVLPSGGKSNIWEERCLAYVAGTRAAMMVFLSGCMRYRTWTLRPSRFLQELGVAT